MTDIKRSKFKVPGARITNNTPEPPEPKNVPDYKKPKLNPKKMGLIKRIINSKVGRTVISFLGGVAGFTGGSAVGLELEWAVVFAGTLIVFLFVGPDKAKQFKTLWLKEKEE